MGSAERTDSPVARKQLRVVIGTSYFSPDHAGIAVYATDFVDYLAEQGHRPTVVTGFPFYPSWRKRPEDRGRLFRTDTMGEVRVLRGYAYVPASVSTARRLVHEFSFTVFAALNLLRAGRSDVVVVFTPPFLLGLVAWAYARMVGARLVINIQDLPVDAAASLGMVRKGWFIRLVGAVESWIYRRADSVVTISRSMVDSVRAKGVPADRTLLVPNWIDVEKASEPVARGAFRAKHGISDERTVVAYAGNLGIKQGLDQLIRLAAGRRADTRLQFVVAGDGADKQRLLDLADALSATNVRFVPFLSQVEYQELLADSDVVFVGQRSGAGDNFFPSKLLGLMAQSKALLIAADADSEVSKEVERLGSGLVAPYDDLSAIDAKLDDFLRDPHITIGLGAAGREGVAQYDRRTVLGMWLRDIATQVQR